MLAVEYGGRGPALYQVYALMESILLHVQGKVEIR